MYDNAAETARNIMAHERLFRSSIACDLVYCAAAVVLLTALYVILKPVSRSLTLLAAFWRLVYALMWVLMPARRGGSLTYCPFLLSAAKRVWTRERKHSFSSDPAARRIPGEPSLMNGTDEV